MRVPAIVAAAAAAPAQPVDRAQSAVHPAVTGKAHPHLRTQVETTKVERDQQAVRALHHPDVGHVPVPHRMQTAIKVGHAHRHVHMETVHVYRTGLHSNQTYFW